MNLKFCLVICVYVWLFTAVAKHYAAQKKRVIAVLINALKSIFKADVLRENERFSLSLASNKTIKLKIKLKVVKFKKFIYEDASMGFLRGFPPMMSLMFAAQCQR